MIRLGNFNSIWTIGFIINGIFVYFTLIPKFEAYFLKTYVLNNTIINNLVDKENLSYVNTYGWRNLSFSFRNSLNILNKFLVINTTLTFTLLLIASFNPDFKIKIITIILLLIFIFIPIISISVYILFYLPRYKYACTKEALKKLRQREEDKNKIEDLEEILENLKEVLKGTYLTKKERLEGINNNM